MHAVQPDRRGRLGLILERDGPTCARLDVAYRAGVDVEFAGGVGLAPDGRT